MPTTSTTLSLPNELLEDNVTYYWRVRGENDWCQGDYAATPFSFVKKGINPLEIPTVTAPGMNFSTCDSTYNYTWSQVTNATRYEIQISKNTAAFSSPIVHENAGGIADTSFTFNMSTSPYGTYYFRVRAKDSEDTASCIGNWSTPNLITYAVRIDETPTLNNPTPHVVTTPDVKVCNLTPNFTWTSVIGANKYHIQVSDHTGFTGTTGSSPFLWEFTTTSTTGLLSTTIDVNLLDVNRTYYWRVRGVNDEQNPPSLCYGPFQGTPGEFIKLGINPGVIPSLTSPDDDFNTCSSTFDCVWSQVNKCYKISNTNF